MVVLDRLLVDLDARIALAVLARALEDRVELGRACAPRARSDRRSGSASARPRRSETRTARGCARAARAGCPSSVIVGTSVQPNTSPKKSSSDARPSAPSSEAGTLIATWLKVCAGGFASTVGSSRSASGSHRNRSLRPGLRSAPSRSRRPVPPKLAAARSADASSTCQAGRAPQAQVHPIRETRLRPSFLA